MTRPYPKSGMTSARWKRISPELVRLDDLVLTQKGVYLKALVDPADPVGGDEYPHAVRWQGTLYLEDGHTRWARHKLRGRQWMTVRIHDIEDADEPPPLPAQAAR